MEETEIKK